MTNLIDKDFWTQVAVCAILILFFLYFLYYGKGSKKVNAKDIELSRCRNIVKVIIATISEAESDKELVQYQDEADQFFIDNYDLLGYSQSMEFYNSMTKAVIDRRNELKEPA